MCVHQFNLARQEPHNPIPGVGHVTGVLPPQLVSLVLDNGDDSDVGVDDDVDGVETHLNLQAKHLPADPWFSIVALGHLFSISINIFI